MWPLLPFIKKGVLKRLEKEEARQVKVEIELTDMENSKSDKNDLGNIINENL